MDREEFLAWIKSRSAVAEIRGPEPDPYPRAAFSEPYIYTVGIIPDLMGREEDTRVIFLPNGPGSGSPKRMPKQDPNEIVRVNVYTETELQAEALVSWIQSRGGKAAQGNYRKNSLSAYVPVNLLVELSEQPGVTKVLGELQRKVN